METVPKRPPGLKKLVTFQASESWRGWLGGLADHAGLSRAATVDQAVRLLATRLEYPEKPPKR